MPLWRERAQNNLRSLDKAGTPLSYCSIMGDVSELRGYPLSFLAIKGVKGDTPNYEDFYQNGSATGTQYYPVYPIAAEPGGAELALQAIGKSQASDNTNLDSCNINYQSADKNVVRPVLVAFPPGAVLSSRVIRIDGFIEGNIDRAGAPVPLVRAGYVENASAIEAIDQPLYNHDIPLNIILRHQDSTGNADAQGRGVELHIDRIQYTESQTRIKIRMVNEMRRPVQGWNGADGGIFLSDDGSKGVDDAEECGVTGMRSCEGTIDDVKRI
jgi:hypothetical protein